jgi:glycosyltransferase involved in cell wall biosynthesis
MKIAIITDAAPPQVNGVVMTYENTVVELSNMGHTVMVIKGVECKKLPVLGYKEIKVAINPWKIKSHIDIAIENGFAIHIATEGPLGLFARLYLEYKKYSFTTCYHTKFPELVAVRSKLKAEWIYPYFRWFHSKSRCIMVPTNDMKTFLENKGFANIKVWTRGVDSTLFNPTPYYSNYILCVSRVSHEKNLDAFCQLTHSRKVLVGDGPYLAELKAKYPDVHYAGKQTGKELAEWYRNASCFVFPSKEDTFGIVLLEAIASGVPVAAYPEPGPKEVVNEDNGQMSEDLQYALEMALKKDRKKVYATSKKWTWRFATENFIKNLV